MDISIIVIAIRVIGYISFGLGVRVFKNLKIAVSVPTRMATLKSPTRGRVKIPRRQNIEI
ncbi:hypothetical protein [Desulfobacter curvatus]|uniref:hypothetical protein n=1 Tax=Desulfobacter curvatus TaxID=2290 RepID=UPI000380B3E8|nr:hypothetical protein [Desulfobacter curvatus]